MLRALRVDLAPLAVVAASPRWVLRGQICFARLAPFWLRLSRPVRLVMLGKRAWLKAGLDLVF